MNTKSLFCVKGCGYLQSIEQQSNEFIALFTMVNNENDVTKKDCVSMNVVVQDKSQQQLLASLLASVDNGHTVIVQFSSDYMMLVNAASGITAEDPQTLITFKVKLTTIEKCFIDGNPAIRPKVYAFG